MVVNVLKIKTYKQWNNKINFFLLNTAVLLNFACIVHWAVHMCIYWHSNKSTTYDVTLIYYLL